MPVRLQLRSAAASDLGRRRTNNEDRYLHDPERGLFAVVDGLGGHAAGEHAAETAVEVLRERLGRQTGTPEERLREAIALANNEIFRLAQANAEWAGMGCVLTAAVIEDDTVTVGHVGDSRLYLARPGEIRKITHDHSPVGEREDRGELSEMAAMQHPRRNEIFRDVGTAEKSPDDPAFIEILSFPLPPDGVILICSDGLSDLVPAAAILECLESNAPNFDAAVQQLIALANRAGGKDNITVVVAACPGFAGRTPPPVARLERDASTPKKFAAGTLLTGLIAGLLVGAVGMYFYGQQGTDGPQSHVVSGSIEAALAKAHSGDTVLIPPGRYQQRIVMRAGVTIRAQQSGAVTLTSPDGGPVVVARGIENGSLEDVWIQGSLERPATPAVLIDSASPALTQFRITGAGTGIEVRGAAAPEISGGTITNNLGPGIDVGA
ncbi:MAG: protein serine/threonine phosphatase, partial [Bryobacterales bacterium]|nr:protein serine/threonine phosphatase [Bryobacterales bacterium]